MNENFKNKKLKIREWSDTRKPRKLGSYSGKCCIKYEEEEVNYLVNLVASGTPKATAIRFLKAKYNKTITKWSLLRLLKNPERYVIGYVKPKSEYKIRKQNLDV